MSHAFPPHRYRTLAGAAALGLVLAGGAALAADPTTAPPDGDSGVVVTAPRVVEQNQDGVTSQVVTMSIHVPFGDLDLRTPVGQKALDDRIHKAADYVCGRLALLYPDGYPDTFSCAKYAADDVKPQVIKARAGG